MRSQDFSLFSFQSTFKDSIFAISRINICCCHIKYEEFKTRRNLIIFISLEVGVTADNFVTYFSCAAGSSKTEYFQHQFKHSIMTVICLQVIQFGYRLTLSWSCTRNVQTGAKWKILFEWKNEKSTFDGKKKLFDDAARIVRGKLMACVGGMSRGKRFPMFAFAFIAENWATSARN